MGIERVRCKSTQSSQWAVDRWLSGGLERMHFCFYANVFSICPRAPPRMHYQLCIGTPLLCAGDLPLYTSNSTALQECCSRQTPAHVVS